MRYTEAMSATDSLLQVNTLATHTALTVWSASSDFLIVIVLVLAFVLFSRYVGRGPFVGVLLAFYASYALFVAFPYGAALPTAPPATALFARVGLYLAFVILFYIILRRVVVSDFLYIGIFGLLILSFLATGFLLALAFNVFPVSGLYSFTAPIAMLFEPKQYFFWWFLAPAVGLFFLAR